MAVLLVVLLVSCIFSVFSEGTYPWWMLLVAVLLVVLLVSCICSRLFRGYLSLVDVTGSRSLGCVACVLYMFPSFQRVPILGGCYWWPFSWLCCLCLVYVSVFSEGTYPWWMLLVAVLLVVLLVSCIFSVFQKVPILGSVTGGRSLGCVACVLYMFLSFRGYLSLVDVTGSRSLGCVACVLYITSSSTVLLVSIQST